METDKTKVRNFLILSNLILILIYFHFFQTMTMERATTRAMNLVLRKPEILLDQVPMTTTARTPASSVPSTSFTNGGGKEQPSAHLSKGRQDDKDDPSKADDDGDENDNNEDQHERAVILFNLICLSTNIHSNRIFLANNLPLNEYLVTSRYSSHHLVRVLYSKEFIFGSRFQQTGHAAFPNEGWYPITEVKAYGHAMDKRTGARDIFAVVSCSWS